MTLTYPACFYRDEGDGAYAVEVPDLPGCATGGDSFDEAVAMGVDAASGWILGEMEMGRAVPPPSAVDDITPDEGGFVLPLVLDILRPSASSTAPTVFREAARYTTYKS
ncbi:MAG: type II toxin-antitoxin system HicB family antitoxin [Synergistaceae bacterium]|jgi:predicted RNase H-like HicB family nuclease|nr:type II toxin-antitoxin system HicB family antitoxin [Synergistaceae bacterium]